MAEPIQTNVDSNLWAEALRVFTENKGGEDRAHGLTKRNQIMFASQGISAKAIRARFKEANMSADERATLFAEEQISRRALDLWSADSDEDFDRLIERAVSTQPAEPEKLGALAGAHAYNDGFNGGAHGGLTVDDNKHVPGTIEHQQWARGVVDGIDYKETFIGSTPRQAPPMQDAGETDQTECEATPKKAKGRSRKQTATAAEPDADMEQAVAASLDETAPQAPTEGVFDMPTPPGLPN